MSVVTSGATSGSGSGLYEQTLDVLHVLSRALSAAHYYETMRTASGQVLACHGVKAGDVPRAAFNVLVGETQGATEPH